MGHYNAGAESDKFKAFTLRAKIGKFNSIPTETSTLSVLSGMPGGVLSIAANDRQAGSGVVWTSHPLEDNAELKTVKGILRAFDVSNVGRKLWNSETNPARDRAGLYLKYNPAIIVNEKVYLPNSSKWRIVYGLLPSNR